MTTGKRAFTVVLVKRVTSFLSIKVKTRTKTKITKQQTRRNKSENLKRGKTTCKPCMVCNMGTFFKSKLRLINCLLYGKNFGGSMINNLLT